MDVSGPDQPYDLEKLDNKLQTFASLWQQYGDIYRVHSCSRSADTWVINHPDLVKQVLVSDHRNYTKGVGIERVRVLLGNGLMASEGEQWRKQRRMLQSAFHKPRIKGFTENYLNQAMQLAARWELSVRKNEPVNITASMSEMTLQVMLQALFSQDLQHLQQQGINPFDLISRESNRDLQFAVKFRSLGSVVQKIVDQRRQENRFPDDLLSHCIQATDSSGTPMSDRQLINEVLTMVVAGHETTAASLTWLWYLLAQHPTVFEQVANEARGVSAEQRADPDAMNALVWIPAVIKETLRLYPPGWLYTRRAQVECQLGEYRIPAGSDVFICSWLLHRHPSYWEHPEQFRPDRFAPGQQAGQHRFAWIPFSAGPRHCIGENFAMSEMMTHLTVLAACFRPVLAEHIDIEIEAEVNLRPKHDLYLSLEIME